MYHRSTSILYHGAAAVCVIRISRAAATLSLSLLLVRETQVASHAADTAALLVPSVCACVAPASHPSNRHRPQSEGAIHCHRHRGSAASYCPASSHPRPHIDDLYTEYCTHRLLPTPADKTAPSHQRQRHVDQPLVSTVRSNRTLYTVSYTRKAKTMATPSPAQPDV